MQTPALGCPVAKGCVAARQSAPYDAMVTGTASGYLLHAQLLHDGKLHRAFLAWLTGPERR